jgi:hypothetical protein
VHAFGQIDPALQLAEAVVPTTQGRDPEALWKQHDLTGWPALLGGTCTWAWEYLQSLRQRRPILEEFFSLETDFSAGLTAYSMLLSLYELAEDAARATAKQLATPTFHLSFPPLFVGTPRDTIAIAARRVFANRPIVARAAERFGANPSTMRDDPPRSGARPVGNARATLERAAGNIPSSIPSFGVGAARCR